MRRLPTLAAAFALSPTAALADDSPPLSIYGFARLDVLVNDSKMSNATEPSYVMLEPSNGQIESELTMTPRMSRIGLSIDKWELADPLVSEGKVEIDFAGGSGVEAIRLRHAYATIATEGGKAELLIGQTWDLLSPLFPSAQNDTQLRYAGNLGDRRSQLRLTLSPTNRVSVGLAAAAPAVLDPQDLDDDGQVDSMAAARPMFQWSLEARHRLGHDDGQVARIGLSGHVARTELGDGTAQTAASIAGHFFVPVGDLVVLLGEAYLGKNLAELGGGIAQGVHPTTGKVVRAYGGWAELALLPTKRHMLAAGTSVDVAAPRDLAFGDRERNGTIYEVLRYRPKPALQLGLEHLYWRTTYRGMGDGVANRFDVHFSVFF